MALEDEIKIAAQAVSTDSYQMSVGELLSQFEQGELVINPDFQRLFRWSIEQKSKFIESLLIGVPIPPLFVFSSGGKWELIDGLQRVSTILQFVSALGKSGEGSIYPPEPLTKGEYLRSLVGVGWDRWDDRFSVGLTQEQKFKIRRARIGVQILHDTSAPQAKFDLFMRLNSGGSPLARQELRNCMLVMTNRAFHGAVKSMAEHSSFREILQLNESKEDALGYDDRVCRLLVFAEKDTDYMQELEDFIDDSLRDDLSKRSSEWVSAAENRFKRVFDLLFKAGGPDVLRAWKDGKFGGKAVSAAFEAIAVGVYKNIDAISVLPDPEAYVLEKIKALWDNGSIVATYGPGVRGTDRVRKSVPLGKSAFCPSTGNS